MSDLIDLAHRFAAVVPEAERATHRVFAKALGFFWIPCPLCGAEFGGHEWRDIDGKCSSIPAGEPNTGTAICPACTRAGRGHR